MMSPMLSAGIVFDIQTKTNTGAGTYVFDILVENNGSSSRTIQGFNLPFLVNVPGGFIYSSPGFSVADGDGDFGSTSENTSSPFFSVLVGASGGSGLTLDPMDEKKLMTFTLISDGSQTGDVNAGQLMTTGTATIFSQFVVDGTDIDQTSDFIVRNGAFNLTTAVPEPSSSAFFSIALAGLVFRRKK